MQTSSNRFTLILEEESEGGYSVYCPALPGCTSQGDDRQMALANIREAIESILELPDVPSLLAETPALIAEEIREVLHGRQQDGLEYARVFLEQLEVPSMPQFDWRQQSWPKKSTI